MEHPGPKGASLPLAALSLALLPLTTFLCAGLTVVNFLRVPRKAKSPIQAYPKKILITGASDPSALALARVLRGQGHTVLGAEYERLPFLSSARFSRAYTRFYKLPGWNTLGAEKQTVNGIPSEQAYVNALANLSENEGRIDVWIVFDNGQTPLSTHSAAFDLMHNIYNVRVISNIPATGSIEFGFKSASDQRIGAVRMREYDRIDKRAQIHRILQNAPEGRVYSLCKFGDSDDIDEDYVMILPKETKNATWDAVAGIHFKEATWYMKEIVTGGTHYAASLLIQQRYLRTFVLVKDTEDPASPSQPVPPSSILHKTILAFAFELIDKMRQDEWIPEHLDMNPSQICHLDIQLSVNDITTDKGIERSIIASDICAFSGTSLQLLCANPSNAAALANCYAHEMQPYLPDGMTHETRKAALASRRLPSGDILAEDRTQPVVDVDPSISIYNFTQTFHSYISMPFLSLLCWQGSIVELLRGACALLNIMLSSKEELFNWADPVPAWMEYCVLPIFSAILGLWTGFRKAVGTTLWMLWNPTFLLDAILNGIGRVRLWFQTRKDGRKPNGVIEKRDASTSKVLNDRDIIGIMNGITMDGKKTKEDGSFDWSDHERTSWSPGSRYHYERMGEKCIREMEEEEERADRVVNA